MHARGIIMTIVIFIVIGVVLAAWWLQARKPRTMKARSTEHPAPLHTDTTDRQAKTDKELS